MDAHEIIKREIGMLLRLLNDLYADATIRLSKAVAVEASKVAKAIGEIDEFQGRKLVKAEEKWNIMIPLFTYAMSVGGRVDTMTESMISGELEVAVVPLGFKTAPGGARIMSAGMGELFNK